MPEYGPYLEQNHKPSTYSATISTDQIILSRHEYNKLVEIKYRLGQSNEIIASLKRENATLKDVVQRLVGCYGNTGNGTNITSSEMSDNTTVHQKDDIVERKRGIKSTTRRDSGVDGVENDEESDLHSSNRTLLRDKIETLAVKRNEAVGTSMQKQNGHDDFNLLLDLDEDNEDPPVPVKVPKATALRNGHYDSTDDQTESKSQLYSRITGRRPVESPAAPPPSPPPVQRLIKKMYRELEPEPRPQPQLGYESPSEEEERASTPASWEKEPAMADVTFDFDVDNDDWKKSAEWDPTPVTKGKEPERAAPPRPGPTLIQAVKPNLRPSPIRMESTVRIEPAMRMESPIKMDDSSASPPTPITTSGPKTARQLYLEKRNLMRALAEAEQAPGSSATSSSGDADKILADPDPNTFRHIYIPNLPGDATLSTLTSIIRTNGQGGIEFISLFRQKAENLDFSNFEDPGPSENIGVNITFTTPEACDAWFKFLFENSSQRLQGNPTKTWLFPNEDSAAEWRKCAVFRRSDYHPSIAGKIDKGGPGGQAALADAQKKGATRVLLVSGLPADVTESDLAALCLPPGNKSLPYDGPTHLASGQSGLSTEEFARWKWLEKIVMEDEPLTGFGDGERRRRANIYAAGVKTAYLARGKIWKKYNRNGIVTGKSSGAYVKVEFVKDECEGPLEELPPWVVVGGDDDDLFEDRDGGDMDD